jgi:hypothetical protein
MMWKPLTNDLRLTLGWAVVAVFVGFLAGSQWANAPGLREEIARLQAELNESKLRHENPSRALEPPSVVKRSVATAGQIQQPTLPEGQQLQRLKDEAYQRALDAWVARTATQNADEYGFLLSEFGLGPEEVLQVRTNLVQLHEKANIAGMPMLELAMARSSYDEMMRSLLSDDDYERYRAYEMSKPALREYEMLTEYALTKHGVSLDPDQGGQLVALIQAAGATTTETWHGPYDPLPKPAAGRAVIENAALRYDTLVTRANSLVEAAAASGVTEDYQALLQEYYTDKAQEMYDGWLYMNRPAAEIRAEIRARMREEMSSSPAN